MVNNQLSVEELAERLGVSKITVYRWVKDRRIPHVRLPGGDIRFDQQKVENWLENRTIKAKGRPVALKEAV